MHLEAQVPTHTRTPDNLIGTATPCGGFKDAFTAFSSLCGEHVRGSTHAIRHRTGMSSKSTWGTDDSSYKGTCFIDRRAFERGKLGPRPKGATRAKPESSQGMEGGVHARLLVGSAGSARSNRSWSARCAHPGGRESQSSRTSSLGDIGVACHQNPRGRSPTSTYLIYPRAVPLKTFDAGNMLSSVGGGGGGAVGRKSSVVGQQVYPRSPVILYKRRPRCMEKDARKNGCSADSASGALQIHAHKS